MRFYVGVIGSRTGSNGSVLGLWNQKPTQLTLKTAWTRPAGFGPILGNPGTGIVFLLSLSVKLPGYFQVEVSWWEQAIRDLEMAHTQ